jgi:acetylglutamate kinase
MKTPVSIVKIGGAFLEDPERLDEICRAFSEMKGLRILVHGGGQRASRMSEELGVKPKMVEGRRITDARSLEIVTMVYGGWANKTLVARLQGLGCNALGVSGADANLIRARKRPVTRVDYGFVGDVEHIQVGTLQGLLEAGLTPVFCALTHNGEGQLLNTNADTIAASLARALCRAYHIRLFYCFENQGVLRDIRDAESVIPMLDRQLFGELREQGVIVEGMLPKLHNCFQALEGGVQKVFIGPSALISGQADKFTEICL